MEYNKDLSNLGETNRSFRDIDEFKTTQHKEFIFEAQIDYENKQPSVKQNKTKKQ